MGFGFRKRRGSSVFQTKSSTPAKTNIAEDKGTSSNSSTRKGGGRLGQIRNDADLRVHVRTKSICNSENLDRLHQQQLQASSPSPTTPHQFSPQRYQTEDPWSEKNVKDAIELWKLDEEQVQRLMELRHNLKDCAHHFKYDPHIILRFMTSPLANDAEPLFRKMVQWRIDNNIDSYLESYKPDPILLDYNCSAILKDFDYDGDPIYVERGGMADGAGLLRRFTKEQLMDYAIYTRELNTRGSWVREYEQRQGRKVKDVTVVYDLKGMNAHHLNPSVLNFFGEMMALNAEKYPGPLKRTIIIRAPSIFRFAWTVVKHFFPQSARDKMVFAGKHPEKILAKYMDLKVLPACICDGGEGQAATGLPSKLDGGIIPDHRQPTPPFGLMGKCSTSKNTNETDLHRLEAKNDSFDEHTERESIVSSGETSVYSL